MFKYEQDELDNECIQHFSWAVFLNSIIFEYWNDEARNTRFNILLMLFMIERKGMSKDKNTAESGNVKYVRNVIIRAHGLPKFAGNKKV